MTNDTTTAPALEAAAAPMMKAGSGGLGQGLGADVSRIPRNKLLSHRKFPNGTLAGRTPTMTTLSSGDSPTTTPSSKTTAAAPTPLACNRDAFAKAFMAQNGRVAEGESEVW